MSNHHPFRGVEHPFTKAAPIELGLHGSLTWQQINSTQVKFGIQEKGTERATVVCDLNQCKQIALSLCEITGIKIERRSQRGVIIP